jgi:prepilin-type N-terminal cleavage/methylation domain-containing protein
LRGEGQGQGNGFTLIELSIVVFILAVIMTASVPYFIRSYNGWMLTDTARSFVTTCQLARVQAVTRQQAAVVRVDLDRQMFWLTQPAAMEDGAVEDQTIRVFQLSDRASLAGIEYPDEPARAERQAQVRFFPNGTCDAVTVVFRGVERGSALAASLDPVTARATVYPVK